MQITRFNYITLISHKIRVISFQYIIHDRIKEILLNKLTVSFSYYFHKKITSKC